MYIWFFSGHMINSYWPSEGTSEKQSHDQILLAASSDQSQIIT